MNDNMKSISFIFLASLSLAVSAPQFLELKGFLGNTYFLVKSVNGSLTPVSELNIGQLVDKNVEKLVFVSHGWLGSVLNQDWYMPLANAFIGRYPGCNVILVDWSGMASLAYQVSAVDTAIVGAGIGNLMKIANGYGIPYDNMVLVGHSLGAHVVGFAGKTVGSGIIPRIIGLDPAMLLFEGNSCEYRLCKTDAKFVTAIHTNGGTNGCLHDIGHADFYPNGGKKQPGCNSFPGVDNSVCDHMRSTEYFVEAVTYPDHFLSTKCINYETYITNQTLCGNVSTTIGAFDSTEGAFYLETNAQPPYSVNE